MGFNRKEFMKTRFVPRESDVPVPDLKAWFGKDEKPVWRVRGLSGFELGAANEAAVQNRKLKEAADALFSEYSKQVADAVKNAIRPETPTDLAKRIEHFRMGSVEPAADMDLAIKVCEAFGVLFYSISNKIIELTGLGSLPGKPKPSGETQKSGPA